MYGLDMRTANMCQEDFQTGDVTWKSCAIEHRVATYIHIQCCQAPIIERWREDLLCPGRDRDVDRVFRPLAPNGSERLVDLV
jgi:hypothetical protein